MEVFNVAEKPSVAKEISRILSRGQNLERLDSKSRFNPVWSFPFEFNGRNAQMIFTSVRGHLTEICFPEEFSNWGRVDPKALLDAPIIEKVSEENKDLEKNLITYAKKCASLILWLDCDREGEKIAFEVAEVSIRANPRLMIFRAVFSAVTFTDIQHALLTLRPPNRNMADAVSLRQELDLRIGSSLTRLMTVRFRNKFDLPTKIISYGPCQFPTLGFVVTRFLAIEKFVSEPFWTIQIHFQAVGQEHDAPVEFKWSETRVYDHMAAAIIYHTSLIDPTVVVQKVQTTPTTKRRPLPMNTVEMSKLAAKHLHIPSHAAMAVAEKLYNQGFISYPRTETDSFSKTIDVKSLVAMHRNHPVWGRHVAQLFEPDSEMPLVSHREGSHDDSAHPPIHPVKAATRNDITDDTEWRLYELISRHFLAGCSPDSVGLQTKVQVKVAEESFSASGLAVKELNYLNIYSPYDKWTGRILPVFHEGQQFTPTSIVMVEGKTEPPGLLSEVELITKMNKFGVGTDATMHEHIKTIQARNYVERISSSGSLDRFKPTVLGLALHRGYKKFGLECSLDLTKPELRAKTEECIATVASGSRPKVEALAEQKITMRNSYTAVAQNLHRMEEVLAHHFPHAERQF